MSDALRQRTRWRNRVAAAAFLFAAPLAGCASVEVPTTVAATGMPNAEFALQKSMQEVDIEMGRMGRLQPRKAAGAFPTVVPAELDRVVAFEWNGPLDGAIESLGKTIGYRVAISAPSNAQPLAIGIYSGPHRIYDLLEQIGEDAGGQATVRVDPQHQTIEVIHHV